MWKNACGVLSEKELNIKLYLNHYCNWVKMHGEEHRIKKVFLHTSHFDLKGIKWSFSKSKFYLSAIETEEGRPHILVVWAAITDTHSHRGLTH